MHAEKYILISGASGGLGRAAVKMLVEKGWHVFAADINPATVEQYKDVPDVSPLLMDILDPDSVNSAFKKIEGQTSGLDAIVNLAGTIAVGSVAEVPLEEMKRVLDVNLLGVYTVNRRFLPLILEKKGRIINISSETGRQTAAPFNGIYALSKYALEAYSDALRRELSFLDIKVIKIQPGAFRTEMTQKTEGMFAEAEKSSVLFKKNIAKGYPYLPKVYQRANDPVILAKTIMKVLSVKNPRTVYRVKQDIPRSILELLPVKWADRIIKRALS